MAGKGETVKYIIDADTSGFSRGMAEAAIESDIAGKSIQRSLSSTSKKTENNFKDIRRNAQIAASSMRNFGVALQGFQTTSIIIGITALSGAILELAGALAAAGSTVTVLAPILAQGGAAALTFSTGVSGLSAAFKAIGKNDPTAFAAAMANLGPAAQSVALAIGGLNKAFNSIKLNTQQALLAGVGSTLLQLGAIILPTVNAGFQEIGQAMNSAFKTASQLAGSPAFSGLLATVFADTAKNINILSGALGPVLVIFTQLYAITAPYVSLLAQTIVDVTKAGAAFLSTAKGQDALSLSIATGVIALQELGSLVGSALGLLTSIFRTSALSGNSLITTLTGILKAAEAWVNSTKGQEQLAALFQFTSLVIKGVAAALGIALGAIFNVVQIISNLNPGLQELIVNFLASSLTLRPLIGYLSSLYQAFKVLIVTVFNAIQQIGVIFTALGALDSIVLVLATGLIILGAIIGGPLGSALIIVGGIIAAYIVLSYLLGLASTATIPAVVGVGEAGVAAGGGLTFAATAATILQAALLPLLLLAAGVLVILGMLGVFSSKAGGAQSASAGLGTSLGALQKSLQGVGSTGTKAATGGLSSLSDSLNSVGDASDTAQGSLASFDKMNVLTPSASAGAGGGIPNIPSLPSLGGAGAIASPTLDTGSFDKAIADMSKNFDGLSTDLGKGVPNPFDAIGKFIDANPGPFLIAFGAIVLAIAAIFIIAAIAAGGFSLATLPLTLTLGLIVVAIIAIIAIVILLVQNWSTVWAFITSIVADVGSFITTLFTNIGNFIGTVLTNIGNFFGTIFAAIGVIVSTYINIYIAVFQFAWDAIVAIWNVLVSFFTGIFNAVGGAVSFLINAIIAYFQMAWTGVQIVWNAVVAWFQGVWNGIVGIFNAVGGFFSSIFTTAWNNIKIAFGAVTGFFQGVWNSIGAVFSGVGDFFSGIFKNAFNGVGTIIEGFINGAIDLINKLIDGINGITSKVGIPKIPDIPHISIPKLAKGGIVDQSTIANVGEDGAEAIVPLENNTQWIDKLAAKINAANGAGSGQPISLTVQIGEDKIATKVINLINEKTQMSGRNTILV